ncbi:MAG: arginine--tRNA ligase [Nitrososphaerales archaeon]
MSFREFAEEAKSLTLMAIEKLGFEAPPNLEWDEPPDKTLGDLSMRVGYQLSKALAKKPSEIVSVIASKINEFPSNERKYVDSAMGHPSGFLNFKVNQDYFLNRVLVESSRSAYGKLNLGNGETILLEHTAVNPNKALHIGHLRNVTLGDSISRILEFSGHKVSVLNYIDDSGLQVADILVGLLHLGYSKDSPPGVKYDHYAGDSVYVSVNRKYETDPKLKEHQKSILKAIEVKDPKIFPLAAEITDRILREQLATCWRMGVYYDLLIYESDIVQSKLWEHTFSKLKAKEIVRLETEGKYEGCWIVSVSGEKEGEDKVLVRADGTATYIAKDTPFAALKVGIMPDRFSYSKYSTQPNGKILWRSRSDGDFGVSPVTWGAGKSITVIDSRQARLQRIIQHILEQLSGKFLEGKYIHLGYEIISLSPKTAASLEKSSPSGKESGIVTMSGRKGTYVNVDDALDSIKERAFEETRKRNESVTDESWLKQVAEKLAISAVKFSLLKQDLDKMIIFDMDDALQLIGETGPYMLYTYARATSISSKLKIVQGMDSQGKLLASESEITLVKLISKFDVFVEKSVKMLAPKWIAHYSFELCEAFNKFYEKNRVIQEENQDIRQARLALVECFRNTLARSLGLLGIETLDRI